MWPADVAGGPHEDARENDGLLCEMEDVVGDDGMAAGERSHHNVNGGKRDLLESWLHQSRPAERRTYPGYSRFETQGSQKLDWRAATIVSKVSSTLFSTYTMSLPSLLCPSRRLSVAQHHCVPFNSLLFTTFICP
jgi:hypothetical protein